MKKLLVLSILMSGCATTPYPTKYVSKESKTHQEFLQSKVKCQTNAAQAVPTKENKSTDFFGNHTVRDDFMKDCMESEGWVLK